MSELCPAILLTLIDRYTGAVKYYFKMCYSCFAVQYLFHDAKISRILLGCIFFLKLCDAVLLCWSKTLELSNKELNDQ